MKIDFFVNRNFITASPFAGVADLKKKLLQHMAIVIIEEEQYFGVLTSTDILRKPHTIAVDCLSAKTEMSIDNSIDLALYNMKYESTDVLPVFDKKKIVGLVFKSDILEYLNEHNKELREKIEKQTKELEEKNNEFKEKIQQQKSELENIIEQRTKELIDLVETKDKFIRIIVHELRNPFSTIVGFLTLLQKNFRKYDTDKIEKFLTHIYYSASVTFDLLLNLAEWLDVKNKKIPFNPERINICKFLTEEITNTSFFADQKQIIINNNVSENVFAMADKNMVKTIFRNLLNNAIKFSETSGEVFISAKQIDKFVEITVKDIGVGLSSELIENLFKVEGINSILGTANETGSGIGLLLCKEFVEIDGGKIWVESVLNQGTEFKFTLPTGQ